MAAKQIIATAFCNTRMLDKAAGLCEQKCQSVVQRRGLGMVELNEALPVSALSIARVLGQSPDCVKLIDTDGNLLWMNLNGLCAMEIDDLDCLVGSRWSSLWPAEGRPEVEDSLNRSLQTGLARFSAACPTAKGAQRWWDVTVYPLHDDIGAMTGFVSISRDVTDRENQRIALESVVAEMRHRLMNSYTIVCSLIKGLARGDARLAEFSGEFQQRVLALAKAQSLFGPKTRQTHLDNLLQMLVAPFMDRDRTRIDIDADEHVVIESRVADAIALAIGEFIVNAAKYGAIENGGQISIKAKIDAEMLRLSWTEDSESKVIATSREGGQGLTIIHQMLSANSANLDMQWHENGLLADMRFRHGFGRCDPDADKIP